MARLSSGGITKTGRGGKVAAGRGKAGGSSRGHGTVIATSRGRGRGRPQKEEAPLKKRPAAAPAAVSCAPAVSSRAQVAPAAPPVEIQAAWEKEGLGFIPLEAESLGEAAQAGAAAAGLLAKDHLLLPTEVANRACDVCGDMVRLMQACPHMNSDLAGDLWEHFLLPGVRAANDHVLAGSFTSAFSELLGLLLFTFREDCWLREQDVHEDWDIFQGFFEDLSNAWTKLLAQQDATLGLAPVAGKPGGYRPRLLAMLGAWEKQTNETLDGVFNTDSMGKPRAHVHAMPVPTSQ